MEPQEPGDRMRWSPKMVSKLVDIWANYFIALRSIRRNHGIYQEIATKLAECGYPVSVKELKSKTQYILNKYKVERSAIKMSNGVPSKWRLFEKVNEMHLAYKMHQNEENDMETCQVATEVEAETEPNDDLVETQNATQSLELETFEDLFVINAQTSPLPLSPHPSASLLNVPTSPSTKPRRTKFGGVAKPVRRVSFQQKTNIMLRKFYRFWRKQRKEEDKFRKELLELQQSSNAHLRQLIEVSTNIKEALLRAVANHRNY